MVMGAVGAADSADGAGPVRVRLPPEVVQQAPRNVNQIAKKEKERRRQPSRSTSSTTVSGTAGQSPQRPRC